MFQFHSLLFTLDKLSTFLLLFLSFQSDENVLIVIGGDDQYSNTNEEERCIISCWARSNVFWQFQQEYMDGRKSFIFSWNTKHTAIHEEALLHYFDQRKKGQKFEYQQKHPSEVSSGSKESEAETESKYQVQNKY